MGAGTATAMTDPKVQAVLDAAIAWDDADDGFLQCQPEIDLRAAVAAYRATQTPTCPEEGSTE